ncbi:hypothetical protein JCM19239_589 [Vibrio variabilis]|uniref:Chlorhexidine efflux transporter domain-containing protein n=1 Tax=Vibrio variabilis TaxID=990271 RepID=A0ABQ0JA45_9VIBR|nr:hypothetical protein JCM19239_589 [Vibrio variabilis]
MLVLNTELGVKYMSVKERLFHAVLFELTALSIIIPVASIATGTKSYK